jgi:hypothetical protein
MKSVIENSPWIQQFITSLSQPMELTEDELNKNHPYRTTIHRKAVIYDEDIKESLGHATTNPSEFVKSTESNDHKTWAVNMNVPNMGLSCSKTCDSYKYTVGSFVYPYELLARHIPDNLISRYGNSVTICGEPCITYGCYNRNVMPLQTKTVREAIENHGKDDAFLIDDNFSCYWNSTEHCTLSLTKSIKWDRSNMKVDPRDQSITFSSSLFDRNPWTVCNYIGVKLSTIFLELAEKNESLESVLEKIMLL